MRRRTVFTGLLTLLAGTCLALGVADPAGADCVNNFTSLSAGLYHALARASNGTAWAWGYNGSGRLGDGTTADRLTPVQVTGLSNVTAVSAGGGHSLALIADGTLWSWGANPNGQLGDGTTTSRSSAGQIGLTGVAAISAGWFHSAAVKSDGTVWTWGWNYDAQLGDGTRTERHSPVQVTGLSSVVAVSAGDYHTLALRSDGTVWAWGNNGFGQLGNGLPSAPKASPVQVIGLPNVAVAIAAGGTHSLALLSGSTVWTWGDNYYGQLGNSTTATSAQPVHVLDAATAIAAGEDHSMATGGDGKVRSWGANTYGQLGDDTTTDRLAPTPTANFVEPGSLDGGRYYSLATGAADGSVWGWGDNRYGQLADDSTISYSRPRLTQGGCVYHFARTAVPRPVATPPPT